ncbi:hypothetical protein WR164_12980 [Philodulcilactobacillus myokoensis]|uniref:NlpC/P60 domain-containing protein n=1 Tax=Philodulcilactobacillus myokoensis TaxID=2929573 RepID=A0A9W6EU16_9LACO|nr:NlpC/P60 family protein [Philodulcilactobacillus myokoensis]GLB47319.1 hypothetical protein WR164_12980 [Philodulcilactobacillus myokoensis]
MKKVNLTKLLVSFIAFVSLLAMGASFSASANSNSSSHQSTYKQVYKEAVKHLNQPYVYGAEGPTSFDCSGFVDYIYQKSANVTLPRTAQDQFNQEKRISRKHLKKGNLVFFGYSKRSISHVGMYIGHGQMIDAQNRGVVKENIDAPWWNIEGYAKINM